MKKQRLMTTKTKEIGVLDSGVGGLTVVKEIQKIIPNESVIYFADTANVPYGDKPISDIKSFALGIMEFLFNEGVKAIIVGCNISSAIAILPAKSKFNIPILGQLSLLLIHRGEQKG